MLILMSNKIIDRRGCHGILKDKEQYIERQRTWPGSKTYQTLLTISRIQNKQHWTKKFGSPNNWWGCWKLFTLSSCNSVCGTSFPTISDSIYSSRELPTTVRRVFIDILHMLLREFDIENFKLPSLKKVNFDKFMSVFYTIPQISYVSLQGQILYNAVSILHYYTNWWFSMTSVKR